MRFGSLTSVVLVTLSVIAPTAGTAQTSGAGPAHFTLTSSAFNSGGNIPAAQVYKGFGCSGGNLSPALSWSGAPPATQSFALLVHDPDAPTSSGWWHWILYNLPATVTSLPEGAGDRNPHLLPAGAVQGRTDFGSAGYGGPCPPPGAPHHYHFRLYALKVAKLDLPANASAALIAFNVHAQALAEADLVGLYGR
jgi:Raf kinase inhibitor-like YbhB/YbcL family protein